MDSADFYFRFNRSTTLERLEIVDRIFSDNDFCRIIDIPAHIPIKLLEDNLCSCSVFYLYRRLRHTLNPLVLKGLIPLCYFNLSLDQIEREENKCSFNKRISQCHQIHQQKYILIPNQICHNKSQLIPNKRHNSSSFLSFIFVTCFIFGLICIYLLSTHKRRLTVLNIFNKVTSYRRRQKLPIFTADSYQQLTHIPDDDINHQQTDNKMRKIIVKYNSTTEQTQPYLHTNKSDFIVLNHINEQTNEDHTLQLNTNPLSDIEDKQ